MMNNKKQSQPNYSDIRQAMIDPKSATLGQAEFKILKRLTTACMIITQIPVMSEAVSIHQSIYPELFIDQSEIDLKVALQLIQCTNTRKSGGITPLIMDVFKKYR